MIALLSLPRTIQIDFIESLPKPATKPRQTHNEEPDQKRCTISNRRLRQSAHAGAERDLRLPECQGESKMQVGVPFLEGGDRAERADERHVGFAHRSVHPLEYAVESDEQPRPDEVRELVWSEATDHSEADFTDDSARFSLVLLQPIPEWQSLATQAGPSSADQKCELSPS